MRKTRSFSHPLMLPTKPTTRKTKKNHRTTSRVVAKAASIAPTAPPLLVFTTPTKPTKTEQAPSRLSPCAKTSLALCLPQPEKSSDLLAPPSYAAKAEIMKRLQWGTHYQAYKVTQVLAKSGCNGTHIEFYKSIAAMPYYAGKSTEELRYEVYSTNATTI
ncbi:Aste57867_13003 [Aphanomyces stellatus]|uniref:Aste57867_13003 protein n=1 Tax=Aphanomyces stellatus TaxID=120398 RepID=A0A485KX23_9STRA|nr:hypothetical protein As57867_012955 [Aphanomyces stellatus]VFT89849.1 Aste57867_13003 [Aphanomyces stellatus]